MAAIAASALSGKTEFPVARRAPTIGTDLHGISLMEPQSPVSPLSLQDKLDRISHERKVLAVLRDLVRSGLNDGDAVRHRDSGAHGWVRVLRTAAEPHPVVVLDDGSHTEFQSEHWRRAAG
jgi:hypothetical protein